MIKLYYATHPENRKWAMQARQRKLHKITNNKTNCNMLPDGNSRSDVAFVHVKQLCKICFPNVDRSNESALLGDIFPKLRKPEENK